ncbi:MAG: phosphotransferase [Anaerolineales bacterium]|nr:phosphotransferase [Anaerolineales bacterium]
MNNQANIELLNILQHYDLGQLSNYEKDVRGFVNTSFTIETIKDGKTKKSFLRRYKQEIKEEELQFEHSLINHLVDHSDLPVACIYKTHTGKSYLHLFQDETDQQGFFYAIFDFLPGNDKYTWVDPRCTDREVVSAAKTLAQFHAAACNLQPQGKRVEPKILELLSKIDVLLSECPQKDKHTIFDKCLIENLPLLRASLQKNLAILSQPEALQIIQCIIHCDFHPGNLKIENEEVTGLFDFDWSKVDFRLFDVALAMWYFFASWKPENDGAINLAPLALFFNTYQEYLKTLKGIGPLSDIERYYLPWMIHAGNLYVLNWTLLDFYSKDVDPEEYLVFLRHSVNCTQWFEKSKHMGQLAEIFS